ncbi:MAG: terpene cyclase/mutase family protein [Verrucomicrobia bacterium]|nr:terpene cyclase/mutase family protein [Verrucomicrobiota bacterium]
MKRRQFLATTIAFGASAFTRAADEPLPRDGKNLSFRNEIRDSLNRSLVWLRAQQNADGSFGKDTLHPALTALPLIAFQREPAGRFAKEEFVAKGYAYLRGFTQPDGGIYSKENGLANYNTSVCLLALVGANEPKDLDTLVKARAYVVGQQAGGMAKPETDGGIGYGSIGASPKRGHPDLDNTVVALEALRATKHLIADKPGTKDLNWNAAIDFVARCQNLPSNKQPWASGDADNKGGFIYYPGFSNAGEVTLEGGGKALRSYGSMSYAGLLSFIYADVKKDDPRVTAAVEWLKKHYTLDENPGLEKSGYFYYLHLMAKGLTAAGITELEVGGKKSDWRLALAERLMKLQQQDGSWLNDTARWKENNSVLVTTYCALTLEILYAQL